MIMSKFSAVSILDSSVLQFQQKSWGNIIPHLCMSRITISIDLKSQPSRRGKVVIELVTERHEIWW